jgi:RHS repeat-associated protein
LYNAANELNKDNGWYEMHYRGYDPATGRMLQIDPFATMYASSTTYNYALNNPVIMNDPTGGQADVNFSRWMNYNPDRRYVNNWNDNIGGDGWSLDGAGSAGGHFETFEYTYREKNGDQFGLPWYEKEWVPDIVVGSIGMEINSIEWTNEELIEDGNIKVGETTIRDDPKYDKNGNIVFRFDIRLSNKMKTKEFIEDNGEDYWKTILAHEFGHVLQYLQIFKKMDVSNKIANSPLNGDALYEYVIGFIDKAFAEIKSYDYNYRENKANEFANNYFNEDKLRNNQHPIFRE